MTPTQTFYALIRPALSRPEFFLISDEGANGMHVLRLYAHPDDMPRLVGRKGANLEALNDLAEAYGAAIATPIRLVLAEPEDPPVRNRLFNPPARWTTDWALNGIQAYLEESRTGCRTSFIESRPGQSVLIIAPAVPLGIAGPLERWLGVMGHQGGIRLSMDAATV